MDEQTAASTLVETAAELACVSALGAHAAQGYLFARPARGFPRIIGPA